MSSFASLPSELLCRIFELLPDFSTLTALTLTSRLFHSIWLTHSHRIAANITPRVISHLTEAENLAAAQEDREALAPQPPLPQQQQRHLQVISRLRRLLHNARIASLMSDSFARAAEHYLWCGHKRLAPCHLRRPEFQHVFYRLWLLGLMPQSYRKTSLKSCSNHELRQLGELVLFIKYYLVDDLEEPRTFGDIYDAGLDVREDMWVEVCDEVESEWLKLFRDTWVRKHGMNMCTDCVCWI